MIDKKNVLNYMMRWEQGTLPRKQVIELFSYIAKHKMYQYLQGVYGREIASLVSAGIMDWNGKVNKKKLNELLEMC